MVDFCPRAFCISYPNVLNNALIAFFDTFNSFFTNQNGIYVFSANVSKSKLKKIFSELIDTEIQKAIDKINQNDAKTKHIYLIDTCKLNDNVVSNDNSEFNISYKILEEGISIDFVKFEDVFSEIFAKYAKEKNKKTIPLKHKNLSHSVLLNLLKQEYGEKRCFLNCIEVNRRIIADMNDSICLDKKTLIDKKQQIDFCLKEAKEYLKSCIE